MKRPLVVIAVVLALGIGTLFSQKDAGSLLHPSFRVFLENDPGGYRKGSCNGILTSYETGPEQDHLVINAGKEYGKIRVSVPKGVVDGLKIGNELELQGTFFLYEEAGNPGQFSLRDYYDSLGIYLGMTETEVGIRKNSVRPLQNRIRKEADRSEEKLQRFLARDDASATISLLLGNDNYLDEDKKNRLRATGFLRLLRMSGFVLTLFGTAVFRILKKCTGNKFLVAFLSGTISFLPVIITGFSISLVRAWIVFLVRLGAYLSKRRFDLLNGGALTFLLLLLSEPELLFSSALQYYGAILFASGILIPSVNALWKRYCRFYTSVMNLICIQAVLLPVTVYYQFRINLWAFVIQGGVTVLTGLFLGFGGGMLLFGTLFENAGGGLLRSFCRLLADFCGFGIHEIHRLITFLSEKAENLPGASIIVGRPDRIRIIFYFLLILAFILRNRIEFQRVRCIPESAEKIRGPKDYIKTLLLLLGILGVGLVTLRASRVPEGELQILMLDVGQGDGFLVRTGDGIDLIVDCGSSFDEEVGEKVLLPVLQYYGIRELDGVFLSHNDKDHRNGLETLFLQKQIGVRALYGPSVTDAEPIWFSDGSSDPVKVIGLHEGDRIRYGSLTVQCLWPRENLTLQGNDRSLVLLCSFYGFRVLFTGDIGGEYEKYLVPGDIDLLKVSHHGSRFSTTDDLLSRITPELALISCGKNNSYGHPAKELLKRLEKVSAKVYRTDLLGAVLVCMNKAEGISVSALKNR